MLAASTKKATYASEVSPCTWRHLLQNIGKTTPEIDFPGQWLNTSTGRAAMLPILTYLRMKGVLANKNASFLVPPWLCLSMLQAMRKHCAPTLNAGDDPKAVLVFHQFGFPQNMAEIQDYCDRQGIVIIEDCANLFEGYFQGKRLGTFGLASIFSFWKTFPSLWGGGLATASSELFEYAKRNQHSSHDSLSNAFIHLVKFLTENSNLCKSRHFQSLIDMSYANAEHCQIPFNFSLNIVKTEIAAGALLRRQKNYLALRSGLKDFPFFETLPAEGVFPNVVPLIAPKLILDKVLVKLRSLKISAEMRNFDVNRNIFNADYQMCIALPVHQDIDDAGMDQIVSGIKSAL